MTRAIKRISALDGHGAGQNGGAAVLHGPRAGGALHESVWDLELTDAEREHLLAALAQLTPREREVACAICSGAAGGMASTANEAVADRLCIALPTLRTHLMRINQKLGTANKGDLVRFMTSRLLDGYRRGVIASPGDGAEA